MREGERHGSRTVPEVFKGRGFDVEERDAGCRRRAAVWRDRTHRRRAGPATARGGSGPVAAVTLVAWRGAAGRSEPWPPVGWSRAHGARIQRLQRGVAWQHDAATMANSEGSTAGEGEVRSRWKSTAGYTQQMSKSDATMDTRGRRMSWALGPPPQSRPCPVEGSRLDDAADLLFASRRQGQAQ